MALACASCLSNLARSGFRQFCAWYARLAAVALIAVLSATPGFASAMSAARDKPAAGADAGGDRNRDADKNRDEALQRWAQMRAEAAPGVLLSREQLLGQPTVSQVRLSPDGRHLFWLERGEQGRQALWLRPVAAEPEPEPEPESARRLLTDLGAVRLHWAGDGRAIWLVDEAGVAIIDIAAGAHRRLWRPDSAGRQQFWTIDAATARYALISEQRAGEPALTRYLRLDQQGGLQEVYRSARPLQQMLLATDGRVRAVSSHEGEDWRWQLRQAGAGNPAPAVWAADWECPAVEPCQLLGADQQGLLLQARGKADKLALYRVAGNGISQRLHVDPEDNADLADVLLPPGGDEWLGVAYEREQRVWYGRNASLQRQFDLLQSRLPAQQLALSASADAAIWLVSARRADRPGAHHYLFWPASGRLQTLFGEPAHPIGNASSPVQPAFAQAGLSPLYALRYRAADGMWVQGWLALPAGKPAAQVPLVAFLHGGPIGRSDNDFDSRVQLLVNRGVAVFLPNFRGSTGHGRAYTEAIAGDVGDGRVLGDIIDGLDHLLAHGIGDPQRQALVGHSFGGYAALLGASLHPQRFRLVFAAAPPTEYGWMKQWQADNDSPALNGGGAPLALQFRHYGFRFTDADWRQRMRADSPLLRLPALRASVAIWAGGADRNVPLKSVAHYAAGAIRLGKPLSLLIDPHSAHAPADAAAGEAYLWLLEALLHRQFATPVEPASAPLRGRLRQLLRQDGAGLTAVAGTGAE